MSQMWVNLCMRLEVDLNLIYQIMPKCRRGDHSDNEVEIITFKMPEDTLDSSLTITSAPTMTFPPPALPEQVCSRFLNGLLRLIGSLLPTLYFHLWPNQHQVRHSANLTKIFTFRVFIIITMMLLMFQIFNLLLNLSNLPHPQTLRALKVRR